MKILLFILAASLSSQSMAENWVYVDNPQRPMYDKDSIKRLGAFSEAIVGVNGSVVGLIRFDCKQARMYPLISSRTAMWMNMDSSGDFWEVREAACSKWWEFWKR